MPLLHAKTLRILVRKLPLNETPHTVWPWIFEFLSYHQVRRLHVCVLEDAQSIDNWLNNPHRPPWESEIRRKLCLCMPSLKEMVFECEIVDPEDERSPSKTWADVVRSRIGR